jgi:hypothetical protein
MTTMTHYCLGKPIFGGSAAVAAATEIIAKMGIKFLGTPIEQFDQLCREEEVVKVSVSCYHTEKNADGTEELVLSGAWGCQIKSSKDIIQFDYEDMKILTKNLKRGLR